MVAKIGIWLVWAFAVFLGMATSPLAAALGLPILAMVAFSPALFLFPGMRRRPLVAQFVAALILGAYAAWIIVSQTL